MAEIYNLKIGLWSFEFDIWNAIEDFTEKWDQVPDFSDQHSGNTQSFAVLLAGMYVANNDELIVNMHGGAAMLVGCEKFGCHPNVWRIMCWCKK